MGCSQPCIPALGRSAQHCSTQPSPRRPLHRRTGDGRFSCKPQTRSRNAGSSPPPMQEITPNRCQDTAKGTWWGGGRACWCSAMLWDAAPGEGGAFSLPYPPKNMQPRGKGALSCYIPPARSPVERGGLSCHVRPSTKPWGKPNVFFCTTSPWDAGTDSGEMTPPVQRVPHPAAPRRLHPASRRLHPASSRSPVSPSRIPPVPRSPAGVPH